MGRNTFLAVVLGCAALCQAHNWLHSPARATNQASTTKPFQQRKVSDIHAQIGPGQRVALQFATGHGRTHYIAIFSSKDQSVAFNNNYGNWVKDYIASAPASINMAKRWPRLHWCSKGSCSGSMFSGEAKKGDNDWCPQPDSTKRLWRINSRDTGTDRMVYYNNKKYPWLLGAMSYTQIQALPHDFEQTCVTVPYQADKGNHYMIHWFWNGYYDVMDVNVFNDRKFPESDLYGKVLGGTQLNRIDHCQFLNPRRIATYVYDANSNITQCKTMLEAHYGNNGVQGHDSNSRDGAMGINVVPTQNPENVLLDVYNVPGWVGGRNDWPSPGIKIPSDYLWWALKSPVYEIKGRTSISTYEWNKFESMSTQINNAYCTEGPLWFDYITQAISRCTWRKNFCWGIAVETKGLSNTQLYTSKLSVRVCEGGNQGTRSGWKLFKKNKLPAVTGYKDPKTWTAGNHANWRINFRPAGNGIVQNGWKADYGNVYSSQNGLQYGWNCKTTMAIDKRFQNDKNYKSGHIPSWQWRSKCPDGNVREWNIQLPNAVYVVSMYMGRGPASGSGCHVENTHIGGTNSIEEEATHTTVVRVMDGKLTLSTTDPTVEGGINACGDVNWIAIDKLQNNMPAAWVPDSGTSGEAWWQMEINNQAIGTVSIKNDFFEGFESDTWPMLFTRTINPFKCSGRWLYEPSPTCWDGDRIFHGNFHHDPDQYKRFKINPRLDRSVFYIQVNKGEHMPWGSYSSKADAQNYGLVVSVSNTTCSGKSCPRTGEQICEEVIFAQRFTSEYTWSKDVMPIQVDCKGKTGKYVRIRLKGSNRFFSGVPSVFRHRPKVAVPAKGMPKVCYGVEARIPTETQPEFYTTWDPADPMFYSTCYLILPRLEWRAIPGADIDALKVDEWTFNGKCLDCNSYVRSKENIGNSVMHWYFDDKCVNCKKYKPAFWKSGSGGGSVTSYPTPNSTPYPTPASPAPPGSMYKFLEGTETRVEPGKKLGTVNLFPNYELTFEVNVEQRLDNWRSILHFGAEGWGDFGRAPGIWFQPDSTKLHVRHSFPGAINVGADSFVGIDLNKWVGIKVWVYEGFMQVYVDSQVVGVSHMNITALPTIDNVEVFATNPKYLAAKATIRNVYYKEYDAPSKAPTAEPITSEPTPMPTMEPTNPMPTDNPTPSPDIPTPTCTNYARSFLWEKFLTVRKGYKVGVLSTFRNYKLEFMVSIRGTSTNFANILRIGNSHNGLFSRNPSVQLNRGKTSISFQVSTMTKFNYNCAHTAGLGLNTWTFVRFEVKKNTVKVFYNGLLVKQCDIQGVLPGNMANQNLWASIPWDAAAHAMVTKIKYSPK
ncbi:hypothetical protein AAMO2058_000804900 [Amorphochlora amoebiformis]